MNDAYRVAFYDVVKETQAKTGYELPEHLEAYVVMLLAYYIDRPEYLPEKSSPIILEGGDIYIIFS